MREMRIVELHLTHFRNHTETVLTLEPGVNLFVGENGQGKTSILEAIFFAAFARSFVPGREQIVVQRGQEQAEVEVHAERDNQLPYWVRIEIPIRGRKKITANGENITQTYEIIGSLPLVVLAPDHRSITTGGPAHRRRFLNTLLSQSHRRYLKTLWMYHQVLKQRNALLAAHRQMPIEGIDAQLEPWNEQLIQYAAELTWWRYQFVQDFVPLVHHYYALLGGAAEQITVRYWSDLFQSAELPAALDIETVKAVAAERLEHLAENERRQGRTLLGPQRDDLIFEINGLPFRQGASQGQHKSLLISLKFAEWHYLDTRFGEHPIALFDDIFSELDEHRIRRVLELLVPQTQLLITTTDRRIQELLPAKAQYAIYHVQDGKVALQTVVS